MYYRSHQAEMNMFNKLPSPIVFLSIVIPLLISACGAAGSETQTEPVVDDSAVTLRPPTATLIEPSPTISATSTIPPTQEPSPTPTQAPRISVSENTNCRSGPGSEYLFQGVLAVGEYAEILARNQDGDYWYVTGSSLPTEGCWLWGEFAQVEGSFDVLPVYTPAPSPTPQVGFNVYLKGFESCGSTYYVVFAIKNVGGERFWSGYVEVQDFATRDTLYYAKERHPFADTVTPVCPPGHGNELWPGETRYIHAPISPVIPGSTTIGIITLCTADHAGGTCVTEYSYFDLP